MANKPDQQTKTLTFTPKPLCLMPILLHVLILLFFTGLVHLHAQASTHGRTDAFQTYKSAKIAVYKKEWSKAMALLKRFETDFPNSNYRDDSRYWLAYAMNKFSETDTEQERRKTLKEETITILNQLINTYKGSSWVDDAKILKLTIAFDLVKMGEKKYTATILTVLNHPLESEADVTAVALDTLARLDLQAAVPYFKKILKETNNPELREKIVFTMKNSSDKQLQALLRQTLTEKPRWVKKVEPVYPTDALRQKIEGQVLLEVVTDNAGNVTKATVLEGHPLLKEAAVNAVMQWKHQPTPVNGKKVSRVFNVTLTFQLY